jgi:hypothetical protein
MTTFSFRLERVLEWRHAQLELAQAALSRVAGECARWDATLVYLGNARAQADALVQSSGPINGADLGALARYQTHIEQQRKIALDRRRECGVRMDQQRARVLDARRDYRLQPRI